MRRVFVLLSILGLLALATGIAVSQKPADSPEWSFNATIIEACSCPMFCQCYFNSEPAGHGKGGAHAGHGNQAAESDGEMEHFCRFNMAFKVNSGHYGDTDLTGATFWIAGDLGDSWKDMKMDWAVVTFDKSTTPEQREGIATVVGHVFPVEWASFEAGEGDIVWEADKDHAKATLDGGKSGELVLKRYGGLTDEPVVIHNLKYWATPRNEGFVMMPNEVEAWRVGEKTFEFNGTNGFMITIDMNSKDVS